MTTMLVLGNTAAIASFFVLAPLLEDSATAFGTAVFFVGPVVYQAGMGQLMPFLWPTLAYALGASIIWGVVLTYFPSWMHRAQKPKSPWTLLPDSDHQDLCRTCQLWSGTGLNTLPSPALIEKNFKSLSDTEHGIITRPSLRKYLQQNTSESDGNVVLLTNVLFSLMDMDQSGAISFKEFASAVVLLAAMVEGNEDARMRACFQVLDIDNNGFIEREELATWVTFLMRMDLIDPRDRMDWTGVRKASAEVITAKYIDRYDTNRDGKISREEFLKLGPMIHFGAWMKEKGLTQWLIGDLGSRERGAVGKTATKVHVAK